MILSDNQIYLASRSPRRRELLRQIGVRFNLLLMRETLGRPVDIDEQPFPGETPTDYIYRIVQFKANEGWKRILQRKFPVLPVLVADTIVALDGCILGKPKKYFASGRDAENVVRAIASGFDSNWGWDQR